MRALVFIGDAAEESLDELCAAAGELALLGVKVFLFQEGRDPAAARAFGEIARLTGGAVLPFDRSSHPTTIRLPSFVCLPSSHAIIRPYAQLLLVLVPWLQMSTTIHPPG